MNIDQLMDRPRLRPRAVAELTAAYTQQLLKCLTPEELELALLRNSISMSNTCHLHDYCDPNQLLIDAWDKVFEAPEEEQGLGESLDLQDSFHVSLLQDTQGFAHKLLTEVLV